MPVSSRPRLRTTLTSVPARSEEGKDLLVFEDPEGLAPGRVAVARHFGFLLHVLLDGTRDRAGLLDDWKELTGSAIEAEQLDEILGQLDDALLLEGERVETARREALDAWRRLPRRPAAFAGVNYAAERDALAAQVARWREASGVDPVAGPVRAILAPHIDPRGGGPCHGAAAAALAASPAEVFLVLGTVHRPIRSPFALTTHDFETPAGVVPTDRGIVEHLAGRGGGNLLEEERAHATEHSVEFPAAWLRVVHADRKDLRIVPVLVGSIHERILSGISPREDAATQDFAAAIRELLDEYGTRLALVASVDFAHVGPDYEDAPPPDAAALERVLDGDRRLLEHVLDLDAEGFFLALHEEQNVRNVCGCAPTWMLLAALEGRNLEGRLLRHDVLEINPSTGSHVSFAAVAWRERKEEWDVGSP